jgi:hypothetical protein
MHSLKLTIKEHTSMKIGKTTVSLFAITMTSSKYISTVIHGCRVFILAYLLVYAPVGLGSEEEVDDLTIVNQTKTVSTSVTTLRHWKIKSGKFQQFLQASQEGIWPYFEKIGARVVGMWIVLDVVASTDSGLENSGYRNLASQSKAYDEVYLLTRYASLEHWRATRNPVEIGGMGSDYDALVSALAVRKKLTITTDVKFLQGFDGPKAPHFNSGAIELLQ